jgi:hypothetical protein
MQPAGHKANVFGCWYLHEWEARALYEAQYIAPRTSSAPARGGSARAGSDGAARQASIHRHYYEVLTPEECNYALSDPDNDDH